MTKGPSRWIAALLGLLVPGTGHLYVGRSRAAVQFFVAMLVAIPVGGYILLLAPPAIAAPLAWIITAGVQFVAAVSSWRAAGRWPADQPRPIFSRWIVVLPVLIVGAGALLLVNRARKSVLVEAVAFPGKSMAPTIAPGDDLILDKRSSARIPGRGAVIAARSTEDPGSRVVKRVAALAGDTIAMHAGTLTLNGKVVPEPGFSPLVRENGVDDSMARAIRRWQLPHLVRGVDTTRYNPDLGDWGPLVVPADSIFLLGDNRNDSYDSRYFGFVPAGNAIGTVRFIYLSRDDGGKFRWARIGQLIR